jgi:tetratricopeptide (TPR) repeat protein
LRSTLVTRARTSVAAAYARKRDFDRAIDSFSHAQEIAPTNANAYDGRGLAKSNKGDNDGAIADLNVAITLDPRSARAFNNRGFAKSRNSDIDGAIADYTEAIRLNGAYTLAYINRGRVKAKKNDLEGAISPKPSRSSRTTPPHISIAAAPASAAERRARLISISHAPRHSIRN